MKILLLIIPVLLANIALCGQINVSSLTKNQQDLEQAIEAIALAENFNGSILLFQSDSTSLEKHFGFTTAEKVKPIDNISSFNIGSISKTICTYALFSLIEKGDLNLEDKISNYLSELPQWSNQISVKQIINYESGLPMRSIRDDYTDENLWNELKDLDSLESTEYYYSNYNNFLQAKIVESISGVSLEEYVQQEYLEPLQMSYTKYTKYPTGLEEPNIARCYNDIIGDFILNNPNILNFDLCFAPVYMTITDLFIWMKYIVRNFDSALKLHETLYQETTDGHLGPLGKVNIDNGKIQEYEFAGQSYSFLTKGYYDSHTSTYLIMSSNNGEDAQIEKMKDKLFKELDIK